MDTSLIINSTTTAGKKAAKAISNINPEKDNSILKTFAQKVNALTSNTYVDATRVNKMSVNEEGGGSTGTIVVDTSHATLKGVAITDIEGGKRFSFTEPVEVVAGYIDVTLG